MTPIRDVPGLIEAIAGGWQPKYLFFWGHQPRKPGTVDKACLSQWWPAPFDIEGVSYPTAEHWMMAEKARLFRDEASLRAILQTADPKQVKRLGRGVQPYDEALWAQHRFEVIVRGNIAKFQQHPALREFLLNTGQRVLVEASPLDRIWGIGLAADHPDAPHPTRWQGLNLLGFALMEVRDRLRPG